MATASPLPNPEPNDKPLHDAGAPVEPGQTENQKKPFVIGGRGAGTGGKDNTNKMVLGIFTVVAVLLGFFAVISTKGNHKGSAAGAKPGSPSLGRVAGPAAAPGALVPQDSIAASQGDTKTGTLEARDIEKTKGNPTVPRLDSPVNTPSTVPAARGGTAVAGNKTLGDIPPFRPPVSGNTTAQEWTPPPYTGEEGSASSQGGGGHGAPPAAAQNGRLDEQYSRPSMVFVAHELTGGNKSGQVLSAEPDNFGLQSGYHVAARLESMASTALHAPVTAVIEYNYDRDGQILIPAGARAVGKITQADASGIVNIVFESLELPDRHTVPISAIGATTSLQAIKGSVTGKNAGKALAVRAAAGLGSTAAMIVGQSNVNGAISQGDLIRQRAADNIGSAADTQVMNMQVNDHIVVSVPGGTEIYLIFTKSQKVSPSTPQTIAVGRTEP